MTNNLIVGKTLWGGFVDERLHFDEIDDGFGGSNKRLSPALFLTKKEALKQYQDVRKVKIERAYE